MDYREIKEIVEVTEWKTANLYIGAKWVLLNVYNTCDPYLPANACQTPHYVLGWPDICGDAKHPDIPNKNDYSDKKGSL